MPIEVKTEIRVFDQEQFHALDRRVMGVVFDVHNEFGRFLDEDLYKAEIAARCVELGIHAVEREVLIRVTYESFTKDYRMDLLLASGVMLEAKAAVALTPAHRNQALSYLFLTSLNHGRLVNLRTERVQHEFVSTRLTHESRRQFTVADDRWRDLGKESTLLKTKLLDLLHDWGAFLDVALYREALLHFLGGRPAVCRPVRVFSGANCIGTQDMLLLTEHVAWAITAVPSPAAKMEEHQQRFLRHTQLRHLQWINLSHHRVELATLSNTE